MINASEILRKLADIIDQSGSNQASNVSSHATLAPVQVDNVDQSDDETMVSPLQQELELLKKATGTPNNVDKFSGGDQGEGEGEWFSPSNVKFALTTPDNIDEDDNDTEDSEYTGSTKKEWSFDKDDIAYRDEETVAPPDKDIWGNKPSKNIWDESRTDEDIDELNEIKRMAGIGQTSNPHNYAEDLRPTSINPRAEAARQFHKNRSNKG